MINTQLLLYSTFFLSLFHFKRENKAKDDALLKRTTCPVRRTELPSPADKAGRFGEPDSRIPDLSQTAFLLKAYGWNAQGERMQ